MALDSGNVRAGISGTWSVAPAGTALPADADTALDAAFKDLGYFSEDGVEEMSEMSTNDIKAFQNAAVVLSPVTESSFKLKVTLIETKKETVELYYATTVDPTTGGIVIDPGALGDRMVHVFDCVVNGSYERLVAAAGQLAERGSVVKKNGEPIGYEVTFQCYPHAAHTKGDGSLGCATKYYADLVV